MFDRAQVMKVEPLGAGRYRVTGGSAPHVVDLNGAAPRCDCDDFAFRGRVRLCKHITAAQLHASAPKAP